MTHGFDDQGRKSDGHGVLTDWWTAGRRRQVRGRGRRSSARSTPPIEPLPGVNVNGALTMGENIADLGGLLLALDAYHASLHGQPAPVLDGFTGDQRVFLGWAQVWRAKIARRCAQAAGGHRPALAGAFPGRRPVRNVDAWYDAFGVKPGDKLYLKPEDRVRIW